MGVPDTKKPSPIGSGKPDISAVDVAIVNLSKVAVEILLSNKSDFNQVMDFNEKLNSQQIEINNIVNKIDNLKIRNPYLK